jgi:hypothetical protein
MFSPYQNVLFHPSGDPTYLAGPIEGKTTTTLNLVECRINELALQKGGGRLFPYWLQQFAQLLSGKTILFRISQSVPP